MKQSHRSRQSLKAALRQTSNLALRLQIQSHDMFCNLRKGDQNVHRQDTNAFLFCHGLPCSVARSVFATGVTLPLFFHLPLAKFYSSSAHSTGSDRVHIPSLGDGPCGEKVMSCQWLATYSQLCFWQPGFVSSQKTERISRGSTSHHQNKDGNILGGYGGSLRMFLSNVHISSGIVRECIALQLGTMSWIWTPSPTSTRAKSH